MLRLPRPRCWPPIDGLRPVESEIHADVATRSGVARTRWSMATAAVRIGTVVAELSRVVGKRSQTLQTRPLGSVAAMPPATLTRGARRRVPSMRRIAIALLAVPMAALLAVAPVAADTGPGGSGTNFYSDSTNCST